MKHRIVHIAIGFLEILCIIPLIILCAFSRLKKRNIDIGLGPEPLINNIHHSKALKLYGYSSETFVYDYWYISKNFDKVFSFENKYLMFVFERILFVGFIYVVMKYRCIYIYFNGGPLHRSIILWRIEPLLLKMANIRVVVMPYGSDIQILDLTPNLYFRNCMCQDYPMNKIRYSRLNIQRTLWIKYADFVIGGCDWVDYLYHWDRLLVAHFSIDIEYVLKIATTKNCANRYKINEKSNPFVILHAPNHRSIKGTAFVIAAIEELKNEGVNVELVLAERKSNEEIIELIQKSDLVVDQLVIGWYAMFAIEAMTLSKPVVCFLRDDLRNLYTSAGLIKINDPPLINATVLTIKEVLRKCIQRDIDIDCYAARGYEYVKEMHSLEAIGNVFDQINRSVGITPNTERLERH